MSPKATNSEVTNSMVTNSMLEILKSLETFSEGGTIEEVAEEAGLSDRWTVKQLLHLQDMGLVQEPASGGGRSLSPAGQDLVERTRGKVALHCPYCQETDFVENLPASEVEKLRHSCGRAYRHEWSFREPLEKEFPTRINRRGQRVYAYEPYQDEEGRWRCGSRTSKHRPCKRFSEPHERCKKHGGGDWHLRSLKTGKYSDYLTETLEEKYETFRTDPEILDLRDEIALMRAKLAEDPNASLGTISKSIDTIGKLVSRIVKREEGLKVHVSVDRLQVIVGAITQVVLSELSVCPKCGEPLDETRTRVAEGIRKLEVFEETEE